MDGVGQPLPASLHQAIAELLPTRREFYEGWLNSSKLSRGTIGIGAVTAVQSFLRQEGASFPVVMARAGEYAGSWIVDEMPAVERGLVTALPLLVRKRMALRLAKRMLRRLHSSTQVHIRWEAGSALIRLCGSPLCGVDRRNGHPPCAFFASAVEAFLRGLGVSAEASVRRCRSSGSDSCLLAVVVRHDGGSSLALRDRPRRRDTATKWANHFDEGVVSVRSASRSSIAHHGQTGSAGAIGLGEADRRAGSAPDLAPLGALGAAVSPGSAVAARAHEGAGVIGTQAAPAQRAGSEPQRSSDAVADGTREDASEAPEGTQPARVTSWWDIP